MSTTIRLFKDLTLNKCKGKENEFSFGSQVKAISIYRVDQNVPIQPLSLSFGSKVTTAPQQETQVSGNWPKGTSIPLGYLQR
jgi:hypothetical protein